MIKISIKKYKLGEEIVEVIKWTGINTKEVEAFIGENATIGEAYTKVEGKKEVITILTTMKNRLVILLGEYVGKDKNGKIGYIEQMEIGKYEEVVEELKECYSFYEVENGIKMLSVWKQSLKGIVRDIRNFKNVSDNVWEEVTTNA